MLNIYPKPSDGAANAPVWLDLFAPSEAEIAAVEAELGASLPGHSALSEIEMSSRLRERHGVLTMSTPTTLRASPEAATVAPLGFVLSPERLVTIRFAASPAFDAVSARLGDAEPLQGGGPGVFTELCEEIVDQIADALEHRAEELATLSTAAFHGDDRETHALKSNRELRAKLRQVGRLGERLSEVRDSLLGLSRIVGFTEQFGCAASEPDIKARLTSLRHDLTSLSGYEEHLANKVQFVLDALSGSDRHRPERRLQGADHRLDRRHPADLGRRHLRDELQGHAGIRLVVGLPLRPGGDRAERSAALDLVQAEGLVLTRGGAGRSAPAGSRCDVATSTECGLSDCGLG